MFHRDIGATVLVGQFDRLKLYCSYPSVTESLDNPSLYCIVSGNTFSLLKTKTYTCVYRSCLQQLCFLVVCFSHFQEQSFSTLWSIQYCGGSFTFVLFYTSWPFQFSLIGKENMSSSSTLC